MILPCVWNTDGRCPTPDNARSVAEEPAAGLYLLAVDPAPPEVPLPVDPATPSIFKTCPSSTVMVCTDEPLAGWIYKKAYWSMMFIILAFYNIIFVMNYKIWYITCTTNLSEILAGVLRLPCNSAERSEQ